MIFNKEAETEMNHKRNEISISISSGIKSSRKKTPQLTLKNKNKNTVETSLVKPIYYQKDNQIDNPFLKTKQILNFDLTCATTKQYKFDSIFGSHSTTNFTDVKDNCPLNLEKKDCHSLNNLSKPSLTATESKNSLLFFSKTKQFTEDISHSQISEISSISYYSRDFDSSFLSDNEKYIECESDPYSLILQEQKNKLHIPLERQNDENFKILKMKEMKKMSIPPNKSTKPYENIIPPHQKDFQNALDYSLIKKKKISHSVKKHLATVLSLQSPHKTRYHFPMYTDKDIGIYEYWQAHMIESKADEDTPTDEEQMQLATKFSLGQIKEAIDSLLYNGLENVKNKKLSSEQL